MVATPSRRHASRPVSLRHLRLAPQQPISASIAVVQARSEADWVISDRGWLGWDAKGRQWVHEWEWMERTGQPLPEDRLAATCPGALRPPAVSVRQAPIVGSINELIEHWQQLTSHLDQVLDALQDRASALDDNAFDNGDPFPLLQVKQWEKRLTLAQLDKRLVSISRCLNSATNPPLKDQREGAFTPHMTGRELI
jgi:hypothetical protein